MFELNGGMFLRPRKILPSAWIGHIPFGGWLVAMLRPRLLVELGTHYGTSYLALCQAVEESGLHTHCYAVDKWVGDEHSGSYGEEVFAQLNDYHDKVYAKFSQLMRMTFDEALDYFDDGTIDLLHIDGLHTYDAVRHDFESWRPKLSPRGVVLFHDICVRERGFGVWKYWEEVKVKYPHFEFLHTHGLGVLVVGADAVPLLSGLLHQDEDKVRIQAIFEHLGSNIRYREESAAKEAAVLECHREIASLGEALREKERIISRNENAIMEAMQALADREKRLSVWEERAAKEAAFAASLQERLDCILTGVADLQSTSTEAVKNIRSDVHQAAGDIKSAFVHRLDSGGALLERISAQLTYADSRRLMQRLKRLLTRMHLLPPPSR